MKERILIYLLILICAVTNIACVNNENYDDNYNCEDSFILDDDKYFTYLTSEGNYYNRNDMTNTEYLQYLSSLKNKSFEIPVSNEEYTQEELYNLIIKTTVRFEAHVYNDEENKTTHFFMGNVYDVDDEYIYIISCAHGIFNWRDEEKIEKYSNGFIDIIFCTDETVECSIDDSFASTGADIAIFRINKNEVSMETLNTIKTINIENYFKITEKDINSYNIYHINNSLCIIDDKLLLNDNFNIFFVNNPNNTNVVSGNSGSGYFNQYGTYLGVVSRVNQDVQIAYIFRTFLPSIAYLLYEANNNYFLQN